LSPPSFFGGEVTSQFLPAFPPPGSSAAWHPFSVANFPLLPLFFAFLTSDGVLLAHPGALLVADLRPRISRCPAAVGAFDWARRGISFPLFFIPFFPRCAVPLFAALFSPLAFVGALAL